MRVACPDHGATDASYLCAHLHDGPAVEYQLGGSEASLVAVCSGCDHASGGDWSSLTAASVRAVCLHCFWQKLGRYGQVPPLNAPGDAPGRALQTMAARNRETAHELGLDRFPRFGFDLDAHTFEFRQADHSVGLGMRVIPIGRFEDATKTWTWAWADPSIPDRAAASARLVQGRLEQLGLDADALADAGLDGAWAAAALGAELLDADMLYRVPVDDVLVFLGLFESPPEDTQGSGAAIHSPESSP